MIWGIIFPGSQRWQSFQMIKAEDPCWKGEISCCLFGFKIVVGWQEKII